MAEPTPPASAPLGGPEVLTGAELPVPAPEGAGLFGDAAPPSAAGTPYRVLARKYRPLIFDDVIGQDAAVRILRRAFALGRVAHAFMLTGVRGTGKTTTARILARCLNCVGPDGTGGPTPEPCGVCPNCVAILADRHPDVVEMDAASRTGVDDVREIIEATRFRPMQARTKVFIVDEVHMLSRNAFNALLKTLEEPPPHVTFVFATTELRKVPVTVLSRCQRFDLRRVSVGELASHFGRVAGLEGVGIEPGALELIARAADGSVRDGMSLLDQAIAQGGADGGAVVTAAAVSDMLGLADRATVFDLLEAVMAGRAAEALTITARAHERGADLGLMLGDLLELSHTLTRLRTVPGLREGTELPELERTRGAALADRLSVPALGRAWQMLLKGLGEVEAAPDRDAAAEMVLMRLCHAAELPSPAELVRRLSGLAAPAVPAGDGSAGIPDAGSGASGTRSGAVASMTVPTASLVVPGVAPAMAEGSAGMASEPVGLAATWGGAGEVPASTGSLALAAPVPDVPAPEAAPSEAAPPVLESFRDVAMLVAGSGEPMLHAHLLHSIHLVRFAPPVMEIRPEASAPRDFSARLAALLLAATGTRWTIAVSAALGEPTLAEQGGAAAAARSRAAGDHPLVRAILEAFPGARLGQVRDSGADAYGLPIGGVSHGVGPLGGAAAGNPTGEPASDPDDPGWEEPSDGMPEFAPPDAEPAPGPVPGAMEDER